MTSDLQAIPYHSHIGVFDSGVGGLSVLNRLRQRLPSAAMTYIGDVACAPYGDRPAAEVLARCNQLVAHLVASGIRLVVIACNTATVIGIQYLRKRWPDVTFVGVEPGVKPAALASRIQRIAVMVTPATATSERLQSLIAQHASNVHVHIQSCPGLASVIERGVLQGPELLEVLEPLCARIGAAHVDVVALGCTHYPFVADSIQSLLGSQVKLIDTADAVASRVVHLCSGHQALNSSLETMEIFSTAGCIAMERLLNACPGFENLKVNHLTVV
jgi:glutamate racemase